MFIGSDIGFSLPYPYESAPTWLLGASIGFTISRLRLLM